jgi:predicted RNase H-like nuclease (RuvC/YqgF family)
MTELVIAFIGFFSTISGSVIVWFVSRRKNKVEVNAMELQNAQQVVKLWKDLYDELNRKVVAMEREIASLRKEMGDIERTSQKKCETCKYKRAYENK